MADYRASEISGVTWTRAGKVIIENPLGQPPTIQFIEEEVTKVGDKNIVQITDIINSAFDETNATHTAVYTALNNLYVALREARDAEAVALPEELNTLAG